MAMIETGQPARVGHYSSAVNMDDVIHRRSCLRPRL